MTQWFKDLRIKSKVIGAIIIITILFVVTCLLSYSAVRSIDLGYQRLISEDMNFLNEVKNSKNAVQDANIYVLRVGMFKLDKYIPSFDQSISNSLN